MLIIVSFTLVCHYATSQEIHGSVHISGTGHEALSGANIYWLSSGVGTTSGIDGSFSIRKQPTDSLLVISFVGYISDTLHIHDADQHYHVYLYPGAQIEEFILMKRQAASFVSKTAAVKSEVITKKGLQSLACCNLGESFENSATVDAGYTDAVSGARQIRMLGLEGTYTQLLTENMPLMYGLISPYGLNYVPGSWMESIQISKGASSVINGYESIAGQINVEYLKPDKSDKLFINAYGNNESRQEINVAGALRANKELSTHIMAHGSSQQMYMDRNDDNFADMPLSKHINFYNRWLYFSNHLELQGGIQYLEDHRKGGQQSFLRDNVANAYGIGIDISDMLAFGKIGIPFRRASTSLGIQWAYSHFDNSSFFGNTNYQGWQQRWYSNIIFQTYIGHTGHLVSGGLSFQDNSYEELFMSAAFNRRESIPGLFGQYTWIIPDKLILISGLRVDNNSLYGTLLTPRIHARYTLAESLILRASAGRGYRSTNIFADNQFIFTSARTLYFHRTAMLEKAWNAGANISKDFHIFGHREAMITIDAYRTIFEDQLVADLEQGSLEAHFYPLHGASYANSYQAEITAELLPRFDVTLAARMNDVKMTYAGQVKEKPFVHKHKSIALLAYQTADNKWKLDISNQYNGSARLPMMDQHPLQYRLPEKSPAYYIAHMQITRNIQSVDVYAGVENITDYRQKNSVIAYEDTFGPYFDASRIWGPVTGRMWYAGIRLKIN